MASPFSSPLFCLLQSYDLEREACIKSLVSEENTKLEQWAENLDRIANAFRITIE